LFASDRVTGSPSSIAALASTCIKSPWYSYRSRLRNFLNEHNLEESMSGRLEENMSGRGSYQENTVVN